MKLTSFCNRNSLELLFVIDNEKEAKKSAAHWAGRNDQNIMVVFPKKNHKPGDLVNVKINNNTSTTLIGTS